MTKNILLCDSDQPMREVMKTCLTWYGYHVTPRADSAGIEMELLNSSYDLFICDYWARPMNGNKVCTMIRSSGEPKVRDTKILLAAQGTLECGDYKFFRQHHIYVMPKLKSPEKWIEKINLIIGSRHP